MVLFYLLIVSYLTISVSKYVTIIEFKSHVYNPAVASIDYAVINGTYLNYNLTLLQVFNTDILVSMNIKKLQKNRKTTTLLHWRHFNYCKFLEIYQTDRIFKILFTNIIQQSFITSCPFREGNYYMKNAYVDAEPLQNILPRGVYHVQVDVAAIEDGIDRVISSFVKMSF